ncbi:MAG TPA: ATP-binding protein [Candidatus Saccharimonadales bacterium]|nr:ATP-binding protein [Candidatus Saccharimonadales bacterium]
MSPSHKAAYLQSTDNQAFAESLFASIGDGAIATDEFGKITHINPAALGMLGFRASELLGQWFPKKIIAYLPDQTLIELVDRPITKAFLTGRPISEKALYRKKDGQLLPVALTVSPIISQGRPIGAIEVFRDITLEEEVDRMKSEFISLASHQLRTPLSAIKTYAHMLLEGYMGTINSGQKQSLKTIVGAANRMNELISTLLNVTRIEAGTIAINPKSTRLTPLIEEILKEHEFQATENNITLSFKPPAGSSTITTDPVIVKEVLANLVGNAIKYTPPNGRVTVSVQQKEKDMLIRIKDTGLGIPQFAQDQVFTKFFRAQNVVRKETSGTGLGLYLVKGLLEALGGTIWFRSTEEVGTTFYVTLPRRNRPASSTRTNHSI